MRGFGLRGFYPWFRTRSILTAIPSWSTAACFSPAERALLAYTDCLVLQHGRVPETLFATLQEHFSDVEILEFTYITCTYAMHATMSKALRLEYDDVDDPVAEVADPSGKFSGLDVMAVVDRATTGVAVDGATTGVSVDDVDGG